MLEATADSDADYAFQASSWSETPGSVARIEAWRDRYGAHESARLYSLIETAKANGLDPCACLRHVFTELPQGAISRRRRSPAAHPSRPRRLDQRLTPRGLDRRASIALFAGRLRIK